METRCVSCKKYNLNQNLNVRRTKQNRLMLLSNCAVCGKKKPTFINIKNSADLAEMESLSSKNKNVK